jgi:hypothetical protein
MEPRQHKRLSEILFAVGGVCLVAGLILLFGLGMRIPGAVLLIIGSASVLIALPTFMLLSMYNATRPRK